MKTRPTPRQAVHGMGIVAEGELNEGGLMAKGNGDRRS